MEIIIWLRTCHMLLHYLDLSGGKRGPRMGGKSFSTKIKLGRVSKAQKLVNSRVHTEQF